MGGASRIFAIMHKSCSGLKQISTASENGAESVDQKMLINFLENTILFFRLFQPDIAPIRNSMSFILLSESTESKS